MNSDGEGYSHKLGYIEGPVLTNFGSSYELERVGGCVPMGMHDTLTVTVQPQVSGVGRLVTLQLQCSTHYTPLPTCNKTEHSRSEV